MTYHQYSPTLGYVQGMSDLLSPIYVVYEADEASSFWAFVGWMKVMVSSILPVLCWAMLNVAERISGGKLLARSKRNEAQARHTTETHQRHGSATISQTGCVNFFAFTNMLC